MSAFDDFASSGQWSEELVRLLYATVSTVGKSRNFPPPAGCRSWAEDDAVQETAHEFLYGPGGQQRVTSLLITATGQESFERLLDTYVHNYLRDQARRTDIGKLVRRINDVAEDDPSLQVAATNPRRWCLTDGPSGPSTASTTVLLAAVKDVTVLVPAWTSETRDAPVADRASFLSMIHALLSVADGSLAAVDIAHAIAAHLDVRRTLPEAPLDPMLELGLEPADTAALPDATVADSDIAAKIFDSLSDAERILHAYQGSTVRELGRHLSVSKSRAATLQQALAKKLVTLLTGYDEPQGPLRHLDRLCSDWVREWTNDGVPTSQELTGTGTGAVMDTDTGFDSRPEGRR